MSQQPSRPVNRVPQIIFLTAAAALVIFMILLGTDTINPAGPIILIVGSTLFAIALLAMAMEIGVNRTGLDKAPPKNEQQ
jgi:hypothetical protein